MVVQYLRVKDVGVATKVEVCHLGFGQFSQVIFCLRAQELQVAQVDSHDPGRQVGDDVVEAKLLFPVSQLVHVVHLFIFFTIRLIFVGTSIASA